MDTTDLRWQPHLGSPVPENDDPERTRLEEQLVGAAAALLVHAQADAVRLSFGEGLVVVVGDAQTVRHVQQWGDEPRLLS